MKISGRKDSQGREVCDIEFDRGNGETFVMSANYLDDGSKVPESELDDLFEGECLCGDCRESAWAR